MEITIMELVQDYGLDSVLIAAAVCILTGLIKMPIKSLAAKTKDPSKYTKYITFLPLLRIWCYGVVRIYNDAFGCVYGRIYNFMAHLKQP